VKTLFSHLAWSTASRGLCWSGSLLFIFGFAGAAFSQQPTRPQSYPQRLAEPGIPDATAVDLTVAWLREVTLRALEASASERAVYWNQIRKIVASSKRLQQSPRGILIRIQAVISELTRAAIVRQASIGQPEPEAERKLENARSIFRSVVVEFQAIDTESEKLLHKIYHQSASAVRASGWTKTELESLRRNLALQQARTYRNQALCFPADSPDSINSLSLALQSVADLAKSSLNEDVVWTARLEQLACLRLLKRFSLAQKLLQHWRKAKPTATIAASLQREAAKLDLARGNINSPHHENLAPSMRTAANFFAAGKLQEAIAAYDRAAQNFAADGDRTQQFKATQTAAAIVRARGDRETASKRFRRLALDQPKHAEAAAVHLVAIGLAAKLAREADAATRPALIQHYKSLLEEHLQHWPQSSAATTVRLWLGRYWMSQQQWSSALQVLTEVDVSSGQSVESVFMATECFLRKLQQSAAETPQEVSQRSELVAQAKDFLQPRFVDSSGNWLQEWDNSTRSWALKLSEMHLRYAPAGHTYARNLLSASLAAAPTADEAWKRQASVLLAKAQIRCGEIEQALKVVETAQQIAPEPADRVSLALELLEAEALAALGKQDRALALYRKLLAAHPENGELHESYGQLLSRSTEQADLRLALQTWQQIEKQSKPAGPRWLRARQARLELFERLGEGEQAEKLSKLTKLLYPQVADSFQAKQPSKTP